MENLLKKTLSSKPMIDIYRIRFSKEKLAQFTPQERAFFFFFGHSLNQMVIFKKLVVFSSNQTPEAYVHQLVSGAQTNILVRHMVGVVTEAWELFNKRYLRGPVGQEFDARLGPLGKTALEALKSHFGGSGLLSKIRNQISFHHPYEADVEAGFKKVSEATEFDNDWAWYIAAKNINCFYFISDLVVFHSMLSVVGEDDLIEAYKKMHAELNMVYDNFFVFAQGFFDALLTKYFAPSVPELCEQITDAPVAFDVWIPFYVRPPEEGRAVATTGVPATHPKSLPDSE